MMDSSINWSSRLAQFSPENSKIPSDITFKFLGAADYGTVVRAHKMIMAMASEVFMKMFYEVNTADMSAKEIVIEDTTAPAFRAMVDAIYGFKTIKESLQGESPHEMFTVLSLVKKYMIPELVLAVKECISSFPLTEDSVLEVAHEAVEFSKTFNDESENLLLACVNFIETKFQDIKSLGSFLQVIAENGDRMSTVHKLGVLMKEKSPCSNCSTSPCQNGNAVHADQFRVGLKITNNLGDSWDPTISYWSGQVVDIVSDNVVGVKRKCSLVEDNDDVLKSGTSDFDISYDGELRFLFFCGMSENA